MDMSDDNTHARNICDWLICTTATSGYNQFVHVHRFNHPRCDPCLLTDRRQDDSPATAVARAVITESEQLLYERERDCGLALKEPESRKSMLPQVDPRTWKCVHAYSYFCSARFQQSPTLRANSRAITRIILKSTVLDTPFFAVRMTNFPSPFGSTEFATIIEASTFQARCK